MTKGKELSAADVIREAVRTGAWGNGEVSSDLSARLRTSRGAFALYRQQRGSLAGPVAAVAERRFPINRPARPGESAKIPQPVKRLWMDANATLGDQEYQLEGGQARRGKALVAAVVEGLQASRRNQR